VGFLVIREISIKFNFPIHKRNLDRHTLLIKIVAYFDIVHHFLHNRRHKYMYQFHNVHFYDNSDSYDLKIKIKMESYVI